MPLRDVIPSRTPPLVTVLLILLNAVAFLFERSLTDLELLALTTSYGVVPAHLNAAALLSSTFLHAGWGHFLPNMLLLWLFGGNLEDRMGHGRFLFFYLACGAATGWSQVFASGDSVIPIVGASGALAGIMGAYFLLFPRSRVLTLVWFVSYLEMVEIPAAFYAGVWFVVQLLSGAEKIGTDAGGISFWALAVGVLVGAVMGVVLRRPERMRLEWMEGA
jgi:membrane associated rhomboid family serine protease